MPQPWSARFPVSLILGLTFALSLVPRTGFAQGTGYRNRHRHPLG